jgi:arylsulfatase A-like enzyme
MIGLPKHLTQIVVLATAFVALAAQPADTNKLNVLFIISDDLRTELGSAQSARQDPQHRFARGGRRALRSGHAQFPLCNPSRVSMLTSRRPA